MQPLFECNPLIVNPKGPSGFGRGPSGRLGGAAAMGCVCGGTYCAALEPYRHEHGLAGPLFPGRTLQSTVLKVATGHVLGYVCTVLIKKQPIKKNSLKQF